MFSSDYLDVCEFVDSAVLVGVQSSMDGSISARVPNESFLNNI